LIEKAERYLKLIEHVFKFVGVIFPGEDYPAEG
jgi:hypothetical protein